MRRVGGDADGERRGDVDADVVERQRALERGISMTMGSSER
jgi:hypothetical protein